MSFLHTHSMRTKRRPPRHPAVQLLRMVRPSCVVCQRHRHHNANCTMASIMTKHRLLLLLVLLAALLPSFARKRKSFSGTERSVRIMNQSEVKIDVFWIHITTRELDASQTEGKGIAFGSDTGISSYTGHSFEIQELPNEKTKKCRQRNCRKAYFSVSANEDQCKHLPMCRVFFCLDLLLSGSSHSSCSTRLI